MNEEEAVQRTNRTAIACSTPVGRAFVAGQEASLRACFIFGSRGGSVLASVSVGAIGSREPGVLGFDLGEEARFDVRPAAR